jgi:hypothetical protein
MTIEIDKGYKYAGELKQQFEKLTPSQEKAVDSIHAFLKDPNSECFVLCGYAGTGKTFLLGGLVKYLQINARDAVLMAPTGRAARVISERHGISANTVHRSIYYLDKLKEYRPDDNPVTYKFYYELKVSDGDQGTIFIVDEASMISDVYSEQEFIRFGSGKLLSDLFSYLGFDGNDERKKIIFIGDDAQLPPVGMSDSPALDPTYLEEEYHVQINQATLTDVVRQKEGGGILNNATNLRTMIAVNKYPAFEFEVDNQTTFQARREGIISNYSADDPQVVEPTQIIVVYSNAQAADYNTAIRSKLFPGKNEITDGDRIIVVKNSYNHEIDLMNGQMGIVSNVDLSTETRNIPLGKDKDGKKKHALLTFRGVVASFIDIQGKKHDIKCRIVENLLNSKERALTSNESKALYIDFCMRNSSLKPGSAIFKHELKSDEYFNALQVKFAYALTCHKAQGGEWNRVTVDFYGRNDLNKDNFRWCYTAITRAKKHLFAIDPPKKSILEPVNPVPIVIAESEKSQSEKGAVMDPKEDVKIAIQNLVDSTVSVSCIHNTPYHLQYSLTDESSTSKVNIHYNGKNVITKVQVYSGPEEISTIIDQQMNVLIGKNIQSLQSKAGEITRYDLSYFKGNTALFAFHEASMERAKVMAVRIEQIKCNSIYHLEYQFDSEQYGQITMNYYFNKVGTLKSVQPKDPSDEKTIEFINHFHGIIDNSGHDDHPDDTGIAQKIYDPPPDVLNDLRVDEPSELEKRKKPDTQELDNEVDDEPLPL